MDTRPITCRRNDETHMTGPQPSFCIDLSHILRTIRPRTIEITRNCRKSGRLQRSADVSRTKFLSGVSDTEVVIATVRLVQRYLCPKR